MQTHFKQPVSDQTCELLRDLQKLPSYLSLVLNDIDGIASGKKSSKFRTKWPYVTDLYIIHYKGLDTATPTVFIFRNSPFKISENHNKCCAYLKEQSYGEIKLIIFGPKCTI